MRAVWNTMAEGDDFGRWTGGCQCGAVRYTLAEAPSGVTVCHCRMCQKASGGPFMAFGRVAIAALTWTRGRPASFASSSIATRGFCAGCGTPLTYQWRPEAISVTLGSLDDPKASIPETRLGLESVLPWSEQVADLPGATTRSWMETLHLPDIVNHQHPDHDT